MEKQQVDEAILRKSEEIKSMRKDEERMKEQMLELKDEVESKVAGWAYQGATRNNIRTLICTLHTVVWEDSGWAPVTLSEIMSEEGLKAKIKAAKLLVHPDKNSGVYRKVLAGAVFNVLMEALTDQ